MRKNTCFHAVQGKLQGYAFLKKHTKIPIRELSAKKEIQKCAKRKKRAKGDSNPIPFACR